ncbi:alpha/beta fold hydrolase [Longitalea arenae]|uniref:alpha/beta fold hydrolase n=1 Tax=Longitalea arenae TaxID=2812558 RepID=UPI0019683268|nr:alpha/beta hydrolase [Longitalea arenae]
MEKILKSLVVLLVLLHSVTFSFAQGHNDVGKTLGIKLNPAQHGYAPVNGLKMYYEIYGKGEPLVLLHGAYSAIPSSFERLIPELSKTRQVIAVELQGHGRTADIDRPITYEQMADDVAAFLGQLKIKKADLFGYSMGGGVALQVSMRHPQLVRKLVLAAASYKTEGCYAEMWEMIPTLTPEMFENTPIKKEYDSLAPRKEFAKLFAKVKKLDETKFDWGADKIKVIKSPMLLIIGDGDVVRPEHAVEMFRLAGGGVPADLKGLPNSQLAILPGTTHVTLIYQTNLLLAMVPPFLDAPMPKL